MKNSLSVFRDQTNKVELALLSILYLATRVPFIFSGFGYRPDAWAVGASGWYSILEGHYVYSRPPGYPLAEGIVAVAPPGQYWLANLITVLFGLGAILLFYRLKEYGLLTSPFWSTVIFIVTPTFWIVSTETLDNVFALFWLLASYTALLNSNYKLSAVFLGIACGFRPASGILIVPALGFLIAAKLKWSKILMYLLVFGVTGIVAFSPVLIQYGVDILPGFALRFWPLQIGYNSIQAFGVIGTLGIALSVLLTSLRRHTIDVRFWLQQLGNWLNRPSILYAVLAIVMVTGLFVRIPDHSEYLLPAIPYMLIFLDSLFSRSPFMLPMIACLVCLSAFVSPQFWALDPVNGVTWTKNLVIQPGTVIQEELDRRRQIEFARAVLSANIPCGSVVMTGWSYPSILYLYRLERHNRCTNYSLIEYTTLLDPEEVRNRIEDGVNVYWVGRTLRHANYAFGQAPDEFAGAVYLDVGVAP